MLWEQIETLTLIVWPRTDYASQFYNPAVVAQRASLLTGTYPH